MTHHLPAISLKSLTSGGDMTFALLAVPDLPDSKYDPVFGDEAAAILAEIVDRTAPLQLLEGRAAIGAAGLKPKHSLATGALLFVMARIELGRTDRATGGVFIHDDDPHKMRSGLSQPQARSLSCQHGCCRLSGSR
jgi:hypothetical protein